MSRHSCPNCLDKGRVCAHCGAPAGVCDCEEDDLIRCPECDLEGMADDDCEDIWDDWDEGEDWEDDQP